MVGSKIHSVRDIAVSIKNSEIKTVIRADIERITLGIIKQCIADVEDHLCKDCKDSDHCDTLCGGWCQEANETAKALCNGYLIFRARWN